MASVILVDGRTIFRGEDGIKVIVGGPVRDATEEEIDLYKRAAYGSS